MRDHLDGFSDLSILVLGDVMLDRFIWGNVDRISPEAPVPVVHVEKEDFYPGGAANVARNLGQRRAQLRFGQPLGQQGEVSFQEAKIRRPIMSVGESTEAGNSFWFDEEESVILPRGAKEQAMIRDLVKKAVRKLTMRKDRKVFRLDAWVEIPEARDNRFSTR